MNRFGGTKAQLQALQLANPAEDAHAAPREEPIIRVWPDDPEPNNLADTDISRRVARRRVVVKDQRGGAELERLGLRVEHEGPRQRFGVLDCAADGAASEPARKRARDEGYASDTYNRMHGTAVRLL